MGFGFLLIVFHFAPQSLYPSAPSAPSAFGVKSRISQAAYNWAEAAWRPLTCLSLFGDFVLLNVKPNCAAALAALLMTTAPALAETAVADVAADAVAEVKADGVEAAGDAIDAVKGVDAAEVTDAIESIDAGEAVDVVSDDATDALNAVTDEAADAGDAVGGCG